MTEHLRVLAIDEKGGQLRVVVAAQPDNAIWIFGGPSDQDLNYIQFVRLWHSADTAPEPTSEEVADAVARFRKHERAREKGRRRERRRSSR